MSPAEITTLRQPGPSPSPRPRPRTPVFLALDGLAPVVRSGLRAVLAPHGDLVYIREDHQRPTSYTVRLLDPYDERARLDLTRLAAYLGEPGHLVLYGWRPVADSRELSAAVALLQGRLRGWLCLSTSGDQLASDLGRIARGEVILTGDERASSYTDRTTLAGLLLTHRELDVLTLITSGVSNEDIAESCFLSINSVKSYIRSAYRKIGVTKRSQALLWGVEHGLATAPSAGWQPRRGPGRSALVDDIDLDDEDGLLRHG